MSSLAVDACAWELGGGVVGGNEVDATVVDDGCVVTAPIVCTVGLDGADGMVRAPRSRKPPTETAAAVVRARCLRIRLWTSAASLTLTPSRLTRCDSRSRSPRS